MNIIKTITLQNVRLDVNVCNENEILEEKNHRGGQLGSIERVVRPENDRFMIKQTNSQFDFEFLMNKNDVIICQRFAQRHGLYKQSQLKTDKSSSHCSLIETSLDKYTKRNSNTKENLNKLQKITDEVKLLTKQVQLSIDINRNNNSSSFTLDERFIGEICYQLERRILILIFSSSKRFYGYSLRYLSSIIDNEENSHARLSYKKRFFKLQNYLLKSHFHFNYHSILTFHFLNQYGIYSDYHWLTIQSNMLTDLSKIRTFCYSILSNNFHEDFNILLQTLELISDLDHKPLFYSC